MQSAGQAVELICGGHESAGGAAHLPLLHHMHGLYASDVSLHSPVRLESEYRIGYSFHRPMVLLDDVVEKFALRQFNIYTGICIDAANGNRVGLICVDGDLRRQTILVDRAP